MWYIRKGSKQTCCAFEIQKWEANTEEAYKHIHFLKFNYLLKVESNFFLIT